MLEVVQRRANTVISSLRNLHEERWKRLGMFSLRCRRLRGDIIEVKMTHGIDKINLGKLFCIDEDRRTRKHILCLNIKDMYVKILD